MKISSKNSILERVFKVSHTICSAKTTWRQLMANHQHREQHLSSSSVNISFAAKIGGTHNATLAKHQLQLAIHIYDRSDTTRRDATPMMLIKGPRMIEKGDCGIKSQSREAHYIYTQLSGQISLQYELSQGSSKCLPTLMYHGSNVKRIRVEARPLLFILVSRCPTCQDFFLESKKIPGPFFLLGPEACIK